MIFRLYREGGREISIRDFCLCTDGKLRYGSKQGNTVPVIARSKATKQSHKSRLLRFARNDRNQQDICYPARYGIERNASVKWGELFGSITFRVGKICSGDYK